MRCYHKRPQVLIKIKYAHEHSSIFLKFNSCSFKRQVLFSKFMYITGTYCMFYWTAFIFIVSATMLPSLPSSQVRLDFIFKGTMNVTDVSSQIEGMNVWLPTWTLVLLGCGFLLFLVITGVLANTFVCIVLVRERRFKKHISNFMLFHISITDMV